MAVLVTGGTGYIGSHTVIELLEENREVVILDNLSNSTIEVKSKIEQITNKEVVFYQKDLLDKESVERVFEKHSITSVIHFAALKAVEESVQNPLSYYHVNVIGTLNLISLMKKYKVYELIYSSSATVYGISDELPITENAKLDVINPYGRTKLMCENLLFDLAKSNNKWKIVMLRYFNPVGAHKSGLIGEEPNGIPNNLMPYITKVASGELEYLSIFGNDYDTPDGTGVRDYIHVADLARGHVRAMNYLNKIESIDVFNLGTGRGYSVLEVIQMYEKISGKKIPYKFKARRAGDVAESFADPSKAERLLGWKAQNSLKEICEDTWNYVKRSNYLNIMVNNL